MTSPSPDSTASPTAPLQVLHITDPQLLGGDNERMLGVDTAQTLQQVLDLAQAGDWPPDLILLTGDCVQNASEPAYTKLKRILQPLGVPCYCLPGNHDDPAMMEAELNSGNIVYQRQVLAGNWQIIMLDSSIPQNAAGYLEEREFTLLEQLLRQEPRRHAIVALHHQPIPVCSEWLDTMALPPNNRERLLHLLAEHRQVRLVLWGHIHQEYDAYNGSLRLLGTPSTCFQFAPKSEEFAIDTAPPGYRWLTLHADGRLETHVKRLPSLPEGLDLESMGY